MKIYSVGLLIGALTCFLWLSANGVKDCPGCLGRSVDYCVKYTGYGCISGFDHVDIGCFNRSDYGSYFCASNTTGNPSKTIVSAKLKCWDPDTSVARGLRPNQKFYNETCMGTMCAYYQRENDTNSLVATCAYPPVPSSPAILYTTYVDSDRPIPPGLNHPNTCYGIIHNGSSIVSCLCGTEMCNVNQSFPIPPSDRLTCEDGLCIDSTNGDCDVGRECKGEICFIERVQHLDTRPYVRKGCVSASRSGILTPKHSLLHIKYHNISSEALFCSWDGCNRNWTMGGFAHPPTSTTTSTSTSLSTTTTSAPTKAANIFHGSSVIVSCFSIFLLTFR